MGRSKHLSKAKDKREGSTGARRRVAPIDAAKASEAGPTISPERSEMDGPQMTTDDRIARARQKISEGFYDRDDVRRAIAEALMFVLSARRD
jgi:hypothetical protein